MNQINKKLIYRFLGKIYFNYNIGKRTWFGTGGRCLIFFEPSNIKQLFFFLKIIPKNFPFFIFGLGSNILFRDGRFNGAVIKLGADFKKIELNKKKKIIKVGCGVKDIDLANFCFNNSISSFEFLVGIPGTLGGALRMNSSCFNGCISDNLKSITVLNSKRELKKINKDEIKFNYRKVELPKDYIFLEAEFFVNFENKIKIKEKMRDIKNLRKKNQPIGVRTGGSTFKNPKQIKAWELIDKIGFRGKKYNNALISKKHPNFFINMGNASSLELEILGEDVKNIVNDKTGIKLSWEIERVGNFEKF